MPALRRAHEPTRTGAAMRERLLDAAFAILAREGETGTRAPGTIGVIALRGGDNPGGICRRFGGGVCV